MNKYDEKGNNNICPYKKGKMKGNAEIGIDSTYCRKCWWYKGVSKRGKNNGVKEIICEIENQTKRKRMKTIKDLTIRVTYRVGLGNEKVK